MLTRKTATQSLALKVMAQSIRPNHLFDNAPPSLLNRVQSSPRRRTHQLNLQRQTLNNLSHLQHIPPTTLRRPLFRLQSPEVGKLCL